ncbi:MAG: hypothetical protein R2941_03885 [Desulfobacterales bacterium]
MLLFFGNRLFLCILSIPGYPLSALMTVFSAIFSLLSLKILKSCRLPFAKFNAGISGVFAFTAACVFRVCLFSGRCIGLSAASGSTASISVSFFAIFFLSGSLKFSDMTSISSVLFTGLEQFGSLIPQSAPSWKYVIVC